MRTPPLIVETPCEGHVGEDIRQPVPAGVMRLWWLGQAGFAVRTANVALLIDPYLSDWLAEKYRGQEFPHVRMMPSPLPPAEVRGVTWCLSSHAHSDHMDPGTIPAVAAGNPSCRFVVPAAERETALARGVPGDRLVGVDAGDRIPLADGLSLTVTASAHEGLDRDGHGRHRYLGFILRTPRLTVYHSGDCVPYPGLAERLKAADVDLALLPVNGRDDIRTRRGIVGNFSWDEAAALCRAAGIPALVPHHIGLFSFNTVPEDELKRQAAAAGADLAAVVPRADVRYDVSVKSKAL